MLTKRPSEERGHFDHGWLRTFHTFSFSDYFDPAHMGYSVLRVINEDWVKPGEGFGTHPHRDMEILTYVVEGALEHKDSMGNGSVIRPGDVQRMTAGTGVTHSEFNHSSLNSVHLLQIWVVPESKGLPPSYEQKTYGAPMMRDHLRLVASRDGREGSVTWHQDVALFASLLTAGKSLGHVFSKGRNGWVQVVSGSLEVNGIGLAPGDGLAAGGEGTLGITAAEDSEFLLFDLP